MAISFTASSATTYDLTSVSVNPDAMAEVTAREGGFVARNRINFGNVTAPTLTNGVMNVLKLLKVPNRTVVTEVYLSAPRETSGVTHNTNSISVTSGTVGLGFIAYKSASHSSTSTDADGFAAATLTQSKIHTTSVSGLPTDPETSPSGSVRRVAAGVAGAAHGWADGSGDQQIGMHFPYGGYVTFQVTGGTASTSSSSVSSVDGGFSGVLEVSARGFKLPD